MEYQVGPVYLFLRPIWNLLLKMKSEAAKV